MYCNYPNIICLQEECNDEEELRWNIGPNNENETNEILVHKGKVLSNI